MPAKREHPRSQRPLRRDADDQHAVAMLGAEPGTADVGGEIDGPLEAAIGDLHSILAATFFVDGIATHSAHPEPTAGNGDLDVIQTHASEIKFNKPAAARAGD